MVSTLTIAIGLGYCVNGSCAIHGRLRDREEAAAPIKVRDVNEVILGTAYVVLGCLIWLGFR